MNFFNAFIVIFVTVFVQSSSAIKCYNCMSSLNDKCIDPDAHSDFKPQECNLDLLKKLSDSAKSVAQDLSNAFGIDFLGKNDQMIRSDIVCQKIVSKVNNQNLIIRGCQLKVMQDANACTQMRAKLSDGSSVTHCSLCSTDGCNSGFWIQPSLFLAVLVPVLLSKFWTLFTA